MNIEDRLKQHLDSEADHLYVPAGSIEASKRRGGRRRLIRFVAGATLAFAVVAGTGIAITVANSGGDGDDIVAATDDAAPAQTEDGAATSRPAPADGSESDDILANAKYSWERVVLPGNGYGTTPIVAYRDGVFVAVRQDFSEESGSQSRALVSNDGREWVDGGSIDLAWTDSVLATELGFIASGGLSDGTGFGIATSPDGVNWTLGALPASEGSHLSNLGAASGNGVTVLAGTRWWEPPIPPIELTAAGVVLAETGDGRLLVTSIETGELLFETTPEVLWGVTGGVTDGLTVFEQETGEIIVIIPFELLDRAYAAAGRSTTVSITHDGYVLELDNDRYTYQAFDEEGNLIQSGPQDQLYRPPRFILTHPDTGEVVVDMPTQEFDEAQQAAYEKTYSEGRSETVVYSSRDGLNWQTSLVELAGNPVERDVLLVAFLEDEFLLIAAYWDRFDNGVVVLRSDDGVSWTETGESELKDLSHMGRVGSELVALSYDRSPRIVTSDDGIVWSDGPRLGSEVSIQAIAGDGPAVAFGVTRPDLAEPVITLTVDGKELTIDGEQGYLSVIDPTSGDLLVEFRFDPYTEEPPAGIELRMDGFDILDSEGAVVLEVSNADIEQAYAEIAPRLEEYTQLPVLYLLDEGEWKSVSTIGLEIEWVTSATVGAGGTIVVTGERSFEGSGSGGSVTIAPDGSSGSYTEATLIASGGGGEGDVATTVWLGTKG
jgi:hypothetical protein